VPGGFLGPLGKLEPLPCQFLRQPLELEIADPARERQAFGGPQAEFVSAKFLSSDVSSAERLYSRWHGARVVP
jgi:hypothetical protein